MEWIAKRAFGSAEPRQDLLRAGSIDGGLSAIRSEYIDRRISTVAFDSDLKKRCLAGVRRMQGDYQKKKAPPLSLGMLQSITDPAPDLRTHAWALTKP